MKKVLITGAGGTVGKQLVTYLLCEGKYNLTLLDLKINKHKSYFKKYKKRLNFIYSDLSNVNLKNIVKGYDYIIHLASVLPPMSEIKKELTEIVNYDVVNDLVKNIKKYNKNAYFIFLSTTSLYGVGKKNVTVRSKKDSCNNEYVESKIKGENVITKNLKNYVILRMPIILSNIKNESIICNVGRNELVNVITKEDASRAIVSVLNNISKVNRKILNIGGNDTFTMSYKTLEQKLYKSYGFSLKYMLKKSCVAKNMSSPVCSDVSKFNNILNYQEDNFDDYLKRLVRKNYFKKLKRKK